MKKKLFVSAMSLIMAIVLMTSTSFAWFTVSTAPEVSSMEVELAATKNLEIAKGTTAGAEPGEVTADDHGDETKFGATVTTFTKATLDIPATYTSSAIKSVKYDTDGRTNGLNSATQGTVASGQSVWLVDSKSCAADFLVWLRTNQTSGNLTATLTCSESLLAVYVKIGSTYTALTDGSAVTLGTVGASGTALVTDVKTAVDIIAFFDGENITAANVDNALDVSGIKVEFAIA